MPGHPADSPALPVGLAGPVVALYDLDPDVLAALVTACPAVAGLSGGPTGAAATYLPRRKVHGVQIGPDAVEVHVVAAFDTPVAQVAEQIRQALRGRVGARAVDVVVEDVQDPPVITSPAALSPRALPPNGSVGSVGKAGLLPRADMPLPPTDVRP